MPELWKDVVGYEGLYQASSLGSVKSLKRKMCPKDKILKPYQDKNGYWCVNLTKNKKQRIQYVHHLVALAFLGPRPKGYHIHHLDNDSSNECITNLEYVSPRRHLEITRKHNGITLLTKWQVIKIRSSCDTQHKLAELYNCNQGSISKIKSMKHYKYL